MASDAAVDALTPPRPDGGRTIHRAGRAVAIAGALGLAGQVLFFEVGAGMNVPIAIGLILLSGWLLRDRSASGTTRSRRWWVHFPCCPAWSVSTSRMRWPIGSTS